MMYYIIALIVSGAGLALLLYKKHLVLRKDAVLQEELREREARLKFEETAEEEDFPVPPTAEDLDPVLTHKKRIPDVVEANKKADTHYARGEHDEAEREYIRVLSLQPDHQEAMNRLGLIYLKMENYQKAELMLKKLVDLFDRNPVYFSNLGIALYKQQKFNEAVVAYEKAISLDDTRPARFISLGQVFFELNNLKKALNNFEAAYKRNVKNTELCFQIVEIAKMIDDIAYQKKYLDRILELEPYNEEARQLLADLKE